MTDVFEEMGEVQQSRNYNPETLRLEYPSAFLEAMPTKEVSGEELYELMQHFDYNPLDCYSEKVSPYPHEVGHDRKYRYIALKVAFAGNSNSRSVKK